MKTPIEPSEIRVGDTIERHGSDVILTIRIARMAGELAWSSKDYCISLEVEADYFLLDRPTPAIELPTEPALGWVKTNSVGSVLGVWCTNDRNPRPEQLLNHKTRSQRYRRDILAFTPATAVPTEAFEQLVAGHDQVHAGREFCSPNEDNVCSLMAAVDKANGHTS